MIICNDCFADSEIRSRIESHSKKGYCDFCKKQSLYTYDTEEDEYLKGVFDGIIGIYTPVSELPEGYDTSRQTFLKHEIKSVWNIFSNLSENQINDILKIMASELYQENSALFDSPIINTYLDDTDYLKENSMLCGCDWNQFVEALKHENRFHTKYMNTKILDVFCSYIRKTYKKGTKFYRGRVSSAKGFDIEHMGAPEPHQASEGRANSSGIRRLYLANDEETTIHEIRAGAFDYISIGCFELKEDITVVDLKMIDKISPIIEALDAVQYLINKEHLNKINMEMGKALRRSDSPLDYVPTQYITDFIQAITHNGKKEYAGIEYQSTLNPNGYNLAIFDPSLFDCISVETYQVTELIYRKQKT